MMRHKKILQELSACDSYINTETLSKLCDVSQRTLMNDLKILAQDGQRNGFSIQVKRGKGYYLNITQPCQYEAYLKASMLEVYDSKQRATMIVATLLLTRNYITQEQLADMLHVSKSIIKTDIVKVKDILLEHHIMIEKKAHYGIRIITHSLHRKMLLQTLYEENDPCVRKAIDEVTSVSFKAIEQSLIQLLKQYQLTTNYNELKNINTFLKITIYTHKYGLNVDTPYQTCDLIFHEMASQIATMMKTHYDIGLLDSELHDIGYFIQTKTKNEQHVHLYGMQLTTQIEDFLKEADAQYTTNFNKDEQFKRSLLAHVSLLLDRAHQSISFTNPLVHEISVKYPVIFNIAIQFTQRLEELYEVQVTQDEIGFIATHFAAHMEKEIRDKLSSFNRIAILCSSGGGSAFLIKLKLESIFPTSRIQTYSLFEQEEIRLFQPDIIFTIMDLEEAYDIPIVKINELLNDHDILNIKNMFGLANAAMVRDTVHTLFQKDLFRIIEDDRSYEDVLQEMGQQIEALQYAQQGYCFYVMEREKFLSTIYNNGVAIPHPINMCGIQDVISIAILKKPLHVKDKEAKLIFMISLRTQSMDLHQQITRVLFDLMSNERKVASLQNVSSFEEFMIHMKEMNW